MVDFLARAGHDRNPALAEHPAVWRVGRIQSPTTAPHRNGADVFRGFHEYLAWPQHFCVAAHDTANLVARLFCSVAASNAARNSCLLLWMPSTSHTLFLGENQVFSLRKCF